MNNHIILIGVLACVGLTSCEERRKSDIPITREEALRRADVRLPLPLSATNVRFELTGKTQDWDLYVSFLAPAADIQKVIQDELDMYARRSMPIKSRPPVTFTKTRLPNEGMSPKMKQGAPKWWTAMNISDGYFIGPADTDAPGPRFWIDEKTSAVFFFEHF